MLADGRFTNIVPITMIAQIKNVILNQCEIPNYISKMVKSRFVSKCSKNKSMMTSYSRDSKKDSLMSKNSRHFKLRKIQDNNGFKFNLAGNTVTDIAYHPKCKEVIAVA